MTRQIHRALRMNKLRLLKKIFSYEELYAVGIRKRKGISTLLDNTGSPFTMILSDHVHWYADPLIYEHEGQTYLFVESFDRYAKKGAISVTEVVEGSVDVFRTIIDEPYHLSFPMIFHWNGEIYMCPESSENNTLNLYRCLSMPYQWEKVCELPTAIPLVDTIVLETMGNQAKMLSSTFDPANGLLVRYITCILTERDGKFTLDINDNEAPFNYLERNGGIPFTVNGAVYLPTQQSTEIDYGVYLNIVPKNGGEKPVHLGPADLVYHNLPPSYDRIGIHTYNLTDRYEVIDLRYLKFMPDKYFKSKIHKKM